MNVTYVYIVAPHLLPSAQSTATTTISQRTSTSFGEFHSTLFLGATISKTG